MIGKIDKQNSIFNTAYLFEKLIPKDSIYKNLHDLGPYFLKDDDFKDIYCEDNGRPSIPPSVLCGVMLLQEHDKVQDEEAIQRVIFDIRWKYALDLPSEYKGFARTNLVNFRLRLLTSNKTSEVFDKLNTLAVKLGLINAEDTQIIDSTNILGRAAVQDTYELLRTAIKKLVIKTRKRGKKQFTDIIHENGLERYLEQEGKANINWQDETERKRVLKELVSDGRRLLDELSARNAAEDEIITKAAKLLSDILEQDITSQTEELEKGIDPEIKKGVAKDRIISTNDTEMRHGRKSASKKFDGYKVHITENRDNEWITNVEVTAGNIHDAEPSLDMVKEQEKTLGAKPKKMLADGAYGTADNRADFAKAGVELVSKVIVHYDDKIHKEDFKIDLEKGCIECVAGQITEKYINTKDSKGRLTKTFVFDKEKCNVCEYKDRCTKSKTGRTIGINFNEKHLQEARAKQKTIEFEFEYRTRSIIERKISQLMNFGLRQARFIGNKKVKLQALFAATVANIKRLPILAKQKEILC